MAIEDIFRALEEQADRDIEAIMAEAREHAQAILEDARREAEQVREQQIAEAREQARLRTAQSLNSVRLEVRKQIASAKERAVARVFEQAREELARARERDDYPQVFKALLEEALAGVLDEFEVLVDPRDVDLARSVLAELGLDAPVSSGIVTDGGVVVALDGGRVLRRNTFEDRLEKYESASQADVAGILFA